MLRTRTRTRTRPEKRPENRPKMRSLDEPEGPPPAQMPLACIMFSDFRDQRNQFSAVEKIRLRLAVKLVSVMNAKVLHLLDLSATLDYKRERHTFTFPEQLTRWFGEANTTYETADFVKDGLRKIHYALTDPLKIITFVNVTGMQMYAGPWLHYSEYTGNENLQLTGGYPNTGSAPNLPPYSQNPFADNIEPNVIVANNWEDIGPGVGNDPNYPKELAYDAELYFDQIPSGGERTPTDLPFPKRPGIFGPVVHIDETTTLDRLTMGGMVRYIFHEIVSSVLNFPTDGLNINRDGHLDTSRAKLSKLAEQDPKSTLQNAGSWTHFVDFFKYREDARHREDMINADSVLATRDMLEWEYNERLEDYDYDDLYPL